MVPKFTIILSFASFDTASGRYITADLGLLSSESDLGLLSSESDMLEFARKSVPAESGCLVKSSRKPLFTFDKSIAYESNPLPLEDDT